MLSEKHQNLLQELSQSATEYDDLRHLVEAIISEHTQQLQTERDLAYDYINQVATCLLNLDNHGNITLVNQELCAITGYSYDELMGENWFDLCIPEDEIEEQKDLFKQVIAGKTKPSTYYENYILTKSGEQKLIAWHNTYQVHPETGELISSFSSGKDITDLKQSEQVLHETQEQLNAILEGVVDGVAVINADEQVLYANDAAAKILGFDSAVDLIDATQDRLIINHDPFDEDGNSLEFNEQALYFALHGETPEPQTVLFRHPETEQEIWADTKAKPIFDENGNIRFAVITLNDITRTRQIEKVKYDLLQEQAQIDTLREFIAKTTHDLSQPLSVINTAVYMLDKSVQDELVQKRTRTIKTQSLRMQAILRDIQQMSILDALKNISITYVDMKSLLDQIAQYSHSLAQEKDIDFHYSATFSGKPLLGNQMYLDRAIRQVLQNALDYTSEGGEVHLNYYEQASHILIEVADTGIGIEEDHLNHIFERFYRADKSRTPHSGSGSGLGLAITKRVVDLHHGRIEVESTVNRGSTFRIYLPLQLSENK